MSKSMPELSAVLRQFDNWTLHHDTDLGWIITSPKGDEIEVSERMSRALEVVTEELLPAGVPEEHAMMLLLLQRRA